MKVLMSLDLSTKSVGVAVFNISTHQIELHTNLISKSKDINERIVDLTSQLFAITNLYLPDFAIIEDLSIINNQKTLVNLGAIRGATIYALALNNCGYDFIKPSEWRKLVGIKQGRRKRAELKQDALDIVNGQYGYNVNDDEAEAILIGTAYLEMIEEIEE